MFKISLIVFFIFFSAHSADAIKCYTCGFGTGLDNACENPNENDTTSVECTPGALPTKVKEMYANESALVRADEYVCYNAKTTSDKGYTGVRGCFDKSIEGKFCEGYAALAALEPGGKMEYCGTCHTDLCNSSNGVHLQLFTSIACLFVVLIASKFY